MVENQSESRASYFFPGERMCAPRIVACLINKLLLEQCSCTRQFRVTWRLTAQPRELFEHRGLCLIQRSALSRINGNRHLNGKKALARGSQIIGVDVIGRHLAVDERTAEARRSSQPGDCCKYLERRRVIRAGSGHAKRHAHIRLVYFSPIGGIAKLVGCRSWQFLSVDFGGLFCFDGRVWWLP